MRGLRHRTRCAPAAMRTQIIAQTVILSSLGNCTTSHGECIVHRYTPQSVAQWQSREPRQPPSSLSLPPRHGYITIAG